VSDGFWDEEASNSNLNDTGDGSDPAITSLRTNQMQGGNPTTAMSPLDFSNTWETVSSSDSDATDDGYPILQALDRERQLEAQGILS
jgi:hypothetical protein